MHSGRWWCLLLDSDVLSFGVDLHYARTSFLKVLRLQLVVKVTDKTIARVNRGTIAEHKNLCNGGGVGSWIRLMLLEISWGETSGGLGSYHRVQESQRLWHRKLVDASETSREQITRVRHERKPRSFGLRLGCYPAWEISRAIGNNMRRRCLLPVRGFRPLDAFSTQWEASVY